MASNLTINDLDATAVQQAEEFLRDFLSAEYPSLDLTAGKVLRDLLIRPAAIFHTLNGEDMDRLRQSMSLKAIEADPTLADDNIVDGVLSNYRVTRAEGSKSTGQITIIITALTTTTVGVGTVFTSNGVNFVTTQTYSGVTEADAVVSDQQKLIVARSDGTYGFTIPVEAEIEGATGDVRRNTRFSVSPEPSGLVDAVAAVDFSGGSNVETNSELIQRFKLGISPSTMASRIHIQALLREAVPSLQVSSITGFGDSEMLRDRHNIFAMSHGGKADIWARTGTLPITRILIKTATLISSADKTWQVTVLRDDAPGFYTVPFILPVDASTDGGSFDIIAETRGLDMSAELGEFVPDIQGLVEGGYSRYQTSVLQFTDPDTDVAGLVEYTSTQEVQVGVMALLDIDTLQSLVNDRDRRNPQADYLVKAPVPAFVAVTLTVQYKSGTEVPDVSAIKQSIVDRINNLGFEVGKLSASMIYDAAHNASSELDALVLAPIDMFCQIRRPDGSLIVLRDGNKLEIPDEPELGVTSRTTLFYADIEDINVALEPIPVLPA